MPYSPQNLIKLVTVCIRLKGARQLKMPNEQQQRRFAAWDLADLEREVAEVHAACDATGSPIVNSHNDLLAGNVMLPLHVRCITSSDVHGWQRTSS